MQGNVDRTSSRLNDIKKTFEERLQQVDSTFKKYKGEIDRNKTSFDVYAKEIQDTLFK